MPLHHHHHHPLAHHRTRVRLTDPRSLFASSGRPLRINGVIKQRPAVWMCGNDETRSGVRVTGRRENTNVVRPQQPSNERVGVVRSWSRSDSCTNLLLRDATWAESARWAVSGERVQSTNMSSQGKGERRDWLLEIKQHWNHDGCLGSTGGLSLWARAYRVQPQHTHTRPVYVHSLRQHVFFSYSMGEGFWCKKE